MTELVSNLRIDNIALVNSEAKGQFSSFLSRDEANTQFLGELRQGIISTNAVEAFQIATPTGVDRFNVESPQQQVFTAYMQGVATRLLSSDFAKKYLLRGQDIPQFNFYITDERGNVNASIVGESNPPTMFFTKELLQRFIKDGREDLIAGVMAHELTHHILDSDENTKMEEAIAYGLPTFLLYYSDYQHSGLREAFDLISDPNRFGELFKFFDVHPGPSLSKRIIMDSEGILAQHLRRKQKDFQSIPSAEPTQIPSEIASIVEDFQHVDVIENDFQKAGLETHPYVEGGIETSTVTKRKIKFISKNLDKWIDTSGTKLGQLARLKRARKINDILQSCFDTKHKEIQYSPKDAIPLFDKIFTSDIPINPMPLVSNLPKTDIFRESGYFEHHGEIKAPSMGILGEIKEAFDEFQDLAGTQKERLELPDVIDQARKLTESLSRVHPEHRGLLNLFDFGEMPYLPTYGTYMKGEVFEIWKKRHDARLAGKPEPEGITPPWDGLVNKALEEYNSTNQTTIANTLIVLGISDPRLATLPTHNPITSERAGEFRYMEAGFPKIMQDVEGKIIGSYDALKDFYGWEEYNIKDNLEAKRRVFFDASYDRMLEQKAFEKPAIDRIQNITTPEDLGDLIMQFPFLLAIPNQLIGGQLDAEHMPIGSEAATALINRLGILLQQDPDKWKPVIKALFSERYEYAYAETSTLPTTELKYTLYDSFSKLKEQYMDNPFSGKNEDFIVHEEVNGEYIEKEIKIWLPEEMGMSLNHPYVKFVLEHARGFSSDEDNILFEKEEALSLLDRAVVLEIRKPNGEDIIPPIALDPQIYFKFIGADGFSKSEDELTQRLIALRKLHPTIIREYDYKKTPGPEEWASRFLLLHARNEVFQFLENNSSSLSPEAFEECLKTVQSKVGKGTFETGDSFKAEITELLEQQFLRNVEIDLTSQNLEPLQIAKSYAIYEKHGFFQRHPSKRWDNGYDSLIIGQLKALQGDHVDSKLLRNFTETILYDCSVQSPELRKALVRGWGESIRREHGIDTTKAFSEMALHPELESYYTNITSIVDEVIEKTNQSGLLHEAMLQELAEALETQSALTHHIFEHSQQVGKTRLLKGSEGAKGPLAEFGLDFVVQDEGTRLKTIDLLTGKLTEQEMDDYIDLIDKRLEKARLDMERYGHSFDSPGWITAFMENPLDNVAAYATKDINFKDPQKRAEMKGRLRSAYDNFWNSSLESRAYYMNLLAFPTNVVRRSNRDEGEYEQLVDFVINKTLPFNEHEDLNSTFNRYTTFGRDLVMSYIKDSSEAEQRLLLSGLMVSAHTLGEVEERDETIIGKAIALTLKNMGPAGVKLAQAIHSYPDTPEPIRNGMEGVKGEANWPTRLQVFDSMEASIPPINGADNITLDGIAHVGKTLGAGAYQFTVRAKLTHPLNELDEVAVTLLRNHVYTFAQNEFKHIQDSLDTFIKRREAAGDTFNSTTIQAMNHVLDQASASSKLETDYDTGKKQAEFMHAQYDGLTVRTGEHTIAFQTVDWIDHGIVRKQTSHGDEVQAYKVASIAKGTPFNKFSQTATPEELKALGIALQATEDMMTLSGKHFDHDRHGDNFNILRVEEDLQIGDNTLRKGDFLVTHYDFGAVNLESPTSEEKAELGRILAITLQAALEGDEKDIKTVLIKNMTDSLGQDHHESNYLSAVLRGLLARGDFIRYLTKEDIQLAEMALFESGTVDQEILNSLMQTMMNQENLDLSSMMNFLSSEPSQVRIHSLPTKMQK